MNGEDWVVLNASPDIREQLAAIPEMHPPGLRGTPIRSVVLTNGDIDHIAGLLTLREKTGFEICATQETLDIIYRNSVFSVLDKELVRRRPICLDKAFSPIEGLSITAFAVPGKVPLFLEGEDLDLKAMGEQTIGLRLTDNEKTVYYIPGCAEVPDWLLEKISDGDLLLFDGTVWLDDEMQKTGTGRKTGSRMGHICMAGESGSVNRFATLEGIRKVFIHINNTNPVLQPLSQERHHVEAAGWEIALDGAEYSP